jgi:hypothetical protein
MNGVVLHVDAIERNVEQRHVRCPAPGNEDFSHSGGHEFGCANHMELRFDGAGVSRMIN